MQRVTSHSLKVRQIFPAQFNVYSAQFKMDYHSMWTSTLFNVREARIEHRSDAGFAWTET